jgi:hypothetical protein
MGRVVGIIMWVAPDNMPYLLKLRCADVYQARLAPSASYGLDIFGLCSRRTVHLAWILLGEFSQITVGRISWLMSYLGDQVIGAAAMLGGVTRMTSALIEPKYELTS